MEGERRGRSSGRACEDGRREPGCLATSKLTARDPFARSRGSLDERRDNFTRRVDARTPTRSPYSAPAQRRRARCTRDRAELVALPSLCAPFTRSDVRRRRGAPVVREREASRSFGCRGLPWSLRARSSRAAQLRSSALIDDERRGAPPLDRLRGPGWASGHTRPDRRSSAAGAPRPALRTRHPRRSGEIVAPAVAARIDGSDLDRACGRGVSTVAEGERAAVAWALFSPEALRGSRA